MTDHDPLCPLAGYGNDATLCPYCPVVAEVRADERERIAQAIEAQHHRAREFCCFSDQIHARLTLDARIARGEQI